MARDNSSTKKSVLLGKYLNETKNLFYNTGTDNVNLSSSSAQFQEVAMKE